jgi:hypothetical protein
MTVQPSITSEKALSPMRLVVYSPYFCPRLGGLETVVQVLAIEWACMGDDVTIILNVLRSAPHGAWPLPLSSFQSTFVSGVAISSKAGFRSKGAQAK